MNQCDKCKRHIVSTLDKHGKWQTIDMITNLQHYLVCHPEELKFTIGDKVVVWWPKSVAVYKISKIDYDDAEYELLEEVVENMKIVKHVLFNKLESIAKHVDNIYKYLYS